NDPARAAPVVHDRPASGGTMRLGILVTGARAERHGRTRGSLQSALTWTRWLRLPDQNGLGIPDRSPLRSPARRQNDATPLLRTFSASGQPDSTAVPPGREPSLHRDPHRRVLVRGPGDDPGRL